MRLTGGIDRGRKLRAPRGSGTRPTASRVREAIFNILGPAPEGPVLDLFAGTGALGIEALSRGAAKAVFVERDTRALAALSRNLKELGLSDKAVVVGAKVQAGIRLTRAATPSRPWPRWPTGRSCRLGRSSWSSTTSATCRPTRRARCTWWIADSTATPGCRSIGPPVLPERVAIYPGSFDPITHGHVDILRRSLVLFDRVIVAVAENVRKQALFTLAERQAMIRESIGVEPRVEVDSFEGLLVDYARKRGARAAIRGLRAIADFEYEFQFAHMNRHLAPDVETVFLMTSEESFYVSSSLVKEVAAMGGDITKVAPPSVVEALQKMFNKTFKHRT
jgi:pantetheine-phosphate adenylyltransferase